MLRRACLVLGLFGFATGCDRRNHSPTAGAGVPTATPPAPAPADLTLLYTSDGRGRVAPDSASASGGLARRATVIDRIRLEGRPVVQLDAGDLLAGSADDDDTPATAYERERRTAIVLTAYARMGIDVVTLGERDLGLGAGPLKAAIKTAKLSVVAANLLGKDDQHPFPVDQLVDAGGISIGVFGILDLPTERAPDLRRLGFHTTDATDAVRASAQSLRARGARLVVGLFHVTGGLARTKEILASAGGVPGGVNVDLVVLGHGAVGLAAGTTTTVGRTLVVHAGDLGVDLGRLDVRALRPGAAPEFQNERLDLVRGIPDHVGVALVERVEIEKVRTAEEQAAAALRRKNHQKDPPQQYEVWTYASNDACAMCHKEQYEQWKTTDHAQALATLKKNKHDLEPACLGCHMTGYLQPGGTRRFETLMTHLPNVGCESCHGGSALHVRSVNKKEGTSRKVGAEVCLGCHTPDQNIGPFEYAVALKAVLGPGHGVPAAQPPAH